MQSTNILYFRFGGARYWGWRNLGAPTCTRITLLSRICGRYDNYTNYHHIQTLSTPFDWNYLPFDQTNGPYVYMRCSAVNLVCWDVFKVEHPGLFSITITLSEDTHGRTSYKSFLGQRGGIDGNKRGKPRT